MINLLDMLFLKNEKIKKEVFSTLYFSFDNLSFVGFNESLICCLKKYDSYQIKKERISAIGERHHEYKYIIEALNNTYFIRYLTNDLELIYDVLIYTVNDLNKIEKIFFPNTFDLPQELKTLNKPILFVDNHINLIHKHGLFTSHLGYEDWDYKNKCLNQLDFSCVDKSVLSYFKKESFVKELSFIKNDGSITNLRIYFIYDKDYYIIDKIEEI